MISDADPDGICVICKLSPGTPTIDPYPRAITGIEIVKTLCPDCYTDLVAEI